MSAGLPSDLGDSCRFSEAVRAGVAKAVLWAMVADGRVERVARGLYRRADAELADLDRIEVARTAPRATICLVKCVGRARPVGRDPGRVARKDLD